MKSSNEDMSYEEYVQSGEARRNRVSKLSGQKISPISEEAFELMKFYNKFESPIMALAAAVSGITSIEEAERKGFIPIKSSNEIEENIKKSKFPDLYLID